MICPNCGREFYSHETLDTEWFHNKYYDYMIGDCPNCGKRYRWTEVYKFDRVEDVEEVNKVDEIYETKER